jgi:hypothetical protein
MSGDAKRVMKSVEIAEAMVQKTAITEVIKSLGEVEECLNTTSK